MKQNHSQAASLSPQSPTWSSVWQRLRRRSCLAALTAASGLLGIATNGLAQRDLQQIPDPDPSVSLASFTLPDGLQANLFGGDGQISKPIHMNFDARGRLWVAGSEVYPQIEPGQPATDKIFILEDTTGDGVADQATVFADNLLIPTGILPDELGGCYVANSTELLYLWDSDGDGRADQRRVVLSGFGTEDTHHLLHTLAWGPDGSLFMNQSIYIHSHVETPWGVKRMNGGGIWRFRPDTMELEIHCLGFVNPWGKIFDDWGQSFATDGAYGEGINYVFPNSVFVTSPGATRIVGGMNPGSPKHCGLEIVSGRHFPESWQGNMITNDFRANRVCRFEVEPQGSSYRSRQLEEVVRSTHQAFRPIDAKMGADGALYIADWYNPIIQHGEVDFRDPRRDRQRGRIWRLTFPDRELVKRDKLEDMKPAALLEQLRLPEQSTRTWAKRMLRRFPLAEVQAELQTKIEAVRKSMPAATEEARYTSEQQYLVELLWAGLHLDYLDRDLLGELLQSDVPAARAAAVRVASDFCHRREPATLRTVLEKAIQDEHPQVRLEAITALRRLPESGSATTALQAWQRPIDGSMDFALWKTLRDLAPHWVPLVESGRFDFANDATALTFALKAVESTNVVNPLLQVLREGQLSNGAATTVVKQIANLADAAQLDALLAWVQQTDEAERLEWILLIGGEAKAQPSEIPGEIRQGLEQWLRDGLTDRLTAVQVQKLIQVAAKWPEPATLTLLWQATSANQELPADLLEAATKAIVDVLLATPAEQRSELVQQIVNSIEQCAAGSPARARWIGQVARWDLKRAVPWIVAELSVEQPLEHVGRLLGPLLEQRGGQAMLAGKMKEVSSVLPPEMAREALRLLRASPEPESALAEALRTSGQLSEVGWKLSATQFAEMVQQVSRVGDPVAGEQVYRRADLQCMNCHAIGGVGSIVGPDMISIGASAPVDYLLESLLDPAAKVKEGYHTKKILTQEGTILTGMVQSFSGGVYRLRMADGSLKDVAEDEIDEIADGSSLMPAGLVDTLTSTDLINLVSFLSNLGRTEAFSIRTDDTARAWQVLQWQQEVHRLMNRTSFDSVTDGRSGLPWTNVLPRVSGLVPAEELPTYKIHANVPPTSFLRTKLQVVEAGQVEIILSEEAGVQLWLHGKPTPVAGGRVALDLPQGDCEIVVALDREIRSDGIRLQVRGGATRPAAFKLPLALD